MTVVCASGFWTCCKWLLRNSCAYVIVAARCHKVPQGQAGMSRIILMKQSFSCCRWHFTSSLIWLKLWRNLSAKAIPLGLKRRQTNSRTELVSRCLESSWRVEILVSSSALGQWAFARHKKYLNNYLMFSSSIPLNHTSVKPLGVYMHSYAQDTCMQNTH